MAEQTEDVQDVTEPQDLEHEIERKRDDLAVTIDAIADRVSPKRVASRSVATAKDAAAKGVDVARAKMVAAQQRVADLRATRQSSHQQYDESGARLANPGMQTFPVERRPVDPKLIAGAVAAVGVVLTLVVRRRRRHR